MPFNLRKPFVRRQTDHGVVEDTGSDQGVQYDADGKAVPSTSTPAGADESISTSVDQLKKFKRTHQWDYNLDYETIVRLVLFVRCYIWRRRRVAMSGEHGVVSLEEGHS